MLRVARKGIVLIEPAETGADHYEPVGNYLYRVCLREIEKAARGINLPALAFGWDNSDVPPKLGSTRIDSLGKRWAAIIGEIEKSDRLCRQLGDLRDFYRPVYFNSFTCGDRSARIGQLRRLCKRLLLQSLWRGKSAVIYPRNVIVAVFKSPLSGEFEAQLSNNNYSVMSLEPNPYIGPEGWGPPI